MGYSYSSRATGHRLCHLSPEAQHRFDILVAGGKERAARKLGVGIGTVDTLLHGGYSTRPVVAKVEAALAWQAEP